MWTDIPGVTIIKKEVPFGGIPHVKRHIIPLSPLKSQYGGTKATK
jgi:hypothetical protein